MSTKENYATDFDKLTTDNVEAELERLKLAKDYDSDDDEFNLKDKVRLTGKGIDFKALRAGQDIEFALNNDEEDNFDWEDEDYKIDYEKIFRYRNMDMVFEGELDDNNNEENDENKQAKTPFEILKVKMLDISPNNDQGVMKRIITPGTGLVIPNGSRVRIHYNAYFEMNDEPFDSTHLRNKTFEFKLGSNQIVWGLEIAVATMKLHEKSQFIFAPEYYCGKQGCEPRVPKDTPVLFEVEIISFIEASVYEQYEATADDQKEKLSLDHMLQICNCLRELGNDNYKRMNYREAYKKYRKAIYLLDNTPVNTDDDEAKMRHVKLKLYLNISQICLKQTKPKKTIFYCKLALFIEPNNVKALFRYGQDFERARKFLSRAYSLQPTNQDIIKEMQTLNEMVAKYNIIEKDLYKKMLGNNKKPELKAIEAGLTEIDFVIDQKASKDKCKELIAAKLKVFADDEKIVTYKVQSDLYAPDMLNFIIQQAKELNLGLRDIKGPTNVIQIFKNKSK